MSRNVFEEGLAVRKAIMGEEYVDKAFASEFTRPFQEFVTECSWGRIWTRPGLDRKTRFLCNLAALTVLGRQHELGVHIRAALRNGCTQQEIQELFLQMAIYVGILAANTAFMTAKSVIESEK